MNKLDKLDILSLPLDKKVLIEASAGTGKTFTIGLIVIRLLLKDDNPLSIDKIVLITFTKAATAELRKKTSEKIHDAMNMWEEENYKENDDLSTIIKTAKLSNDYNKKRAKLLEAIARIDEMPIFTIHGFCARLLSEFAFETKSFEEKEIVTDLRNLENRVVTDFWRREIEKLDDLEVKYLPREFSPETLKIGLQKIDNFPYSTIKHEEEYSNFNLKEKIKQLSDKINTSRENCINYKSKIEKYSSENNITIRYKKEGKIFKYIFKEDEKKNILFHEYNDCVDEYNNLLAEEIDIGYKLISKLQYQLAKEFLSSLHIEKEKLKIRSNNDLIENTFKAVENDSNKVLFNAVKKKYEAILVDEFQDTDKMQYKIFSYLFNGKPFFMIGDPKQAIYRFRGGDIYAYIEAKSKLEETPKTMVKNYRSQEKLLTALNTIYNVNNPFENENIQYINVTHGNNLLPLKINNKEQKPFVLKNTEYKNNNDLLTIKNEIINEIACLLYNVNTEVYDNDKKEYRKINAKDIAILTRTNNMAKDYRDALKENRKSIPAVIRRSDSVFLSDAADYLMRLLTAFFHSQKESCVKAAIMEPKELTQNDIKPFAEAFDNWTKYGIMMALNKYFDTNRIWGKVYSESNGERNATNLRHLIEILSKEEAVTGRIPERLIKRFSELINDERSEENEEKLETDDDAIQIMTIHNSKGLQFPIVFVPDIKLANEKPMRQIYEKEPPLYHNGNDIIIEYEISNRKNDGNAKIKEDIEILEESARNFYVAITRAIYRLYVINAYKNNEKLSTGQRICKEIKEDDNILIVNNLDNLDYYKCIEKPSLITTIKKEKLYMPKTLPGKVEPSWYRTSFTDISYRLEHIEYANIKKKNEKGNEPPGGKRMGLLLHSIFEDLNFGANDEDILNMLEDKLGGYNEFSTEEGAKMKKWIKDKINAILYKNLLNAGKLYEIKDESKIAELSFFMSSNDMNLSKIKEIMGTKINEFETNDLVAKYIKGTIDLVFLGKDGKYYILDWKSNSLNDFTWEGMENEAMIPHGYHLQYYIYAVALKRWLEKTQTGFDFNKHFGGAYYIFIRGVKDEEDNYDGIYFADSKDIKEDIIKLDICFGGKGK